MSAIVNVMNSSKPLWTGDDKAVYGSLDLDFEHSMAPWAVDMRDLNIYAQSWASSLPSPGTQKGTSDGSVQGIDPWAAIGKAAGKSGLTPGALQQSGPTSRTWSPSIASQYQGDLHQLSLPSEQMSGGNRQGPSPSRSHNSDRSATRTPSSVSIETPRLSEAPSNSNSVGTTDQNEMPIWLHHLNRDQPKARLCDQSHPDLHATYSHQSAPSNDNLAIDAGVQMNHPSNSSKWDITDHSNIMNALAAQMSMEQSNVPMHDSLDGQPFAQRQQYHQMQYPAQPRSMGDLFPSQSPANDDKLDPMPFLATLAQGQEIVIAQPHQPRAQQRDGSAKQRRIEGATNAGKEALVTNQAVSPEGFDGPGAPLHSEDCIDNSNTLSVKGSISKVTVTKRTLSADGADASHTGSAAPAADDEVQMRHVCPHEGCTKHFSTSGHARRHSRIHDDLRPYECPHRDCHATFTRRDNCTQHQRARHGSQLQAHRLGA